MAIAGFEDQGRKPQAKKDRQRLEATRVKENRRRPPKETPFLGSKIKKQPACGHFAKHTGGGQRTPSTALGVNFEYLQMGRLRALCKQS